MTARAAAELGRRLERVGVLPDAAAVRLLRLDELRAATRTRTVPADLADRVDPARSAPNPLPARFRLTPEGDPVAVAVARGAGDVGAGGRTASGPVHVGDDPPAGSVLVVTHLDPRLAVVVPRLAGLVAETGSPLSHLAILAREHGVATVVGHAGAVSRCAPGTVVEVDGWAGTVHVLEPSPGDLPGAVLPLGVRAAPPASGTAAAAAGAAAGGEDPPTVVPIGARA